MKLRFAIPKGSLERETFRVLEEAGYRIEGHERSYRLSINDPELEVRMLRPQEIPGLVEEGYYDIGITGLDWVVETEANVKILQDLNYGRVRLVLAVSKDWRDIVDFNSLLKKMLERRGYLKIYTEYPNITSKWIMRKEVYVELYENLEPLIITPWLKRGRNSKVRIYLSFGATEAKPPEIADAIVDVTSTGTTLEENNLKPIETLMTSTAQLIANKTSLRDKEKREKILDVHSLLKGVIEARRKIHIFMNVKSENLNRIVKSLPALKSPTISPLSRDGWYAVNTIVDEDVLLRVLPIIRRYAQGLVIHKPRQVLPLDEISESIGVEYEDTNDRKE